MNRFIYCINNIRPNGGTIPITIGKKYKVIHCYYFAGKISQYVILNNNGKDEILNSNLFITEAEYLEQQRNNKINKLLDNESR